MWLSNNLMHLSIHLLIGCSHVLAIINNTAMDTEVHISFWITVLFSLDIYPRVKLLDHLIVLFVTFWWTCILLFIIAAPFPFLSTVYEGSWYSTTSLTFVTCFFCFYNAHSERCAVISDYGFDLHFPDN